MKVNGCKYVMIILLLAKNLVSKFFLFKNGAGKFLVKQRNSSSPGCKDDTCLASSIIKKIEILDEKERKDRQVSSLQRKRKKKGKRLCF